VWGQLLKRLRSRSSILSLRTDMILLRIYLLAGLLAHKFVWELLKRRPGRENTKTRKSLSSSIVSVKAVKIAMLLGIIVQTLAPEILPITNEPSALRVVGVSIYTLGLLMAVLSRIHLGRNWSDIEAGRVLQEQAVVSKGIYGYVRHPIYVGDLLLLFGLELSLNSWLVIAVVLLAPVVLWMAVREEKMLLEGLPGYRVYCAHTKRFIPFIV
jgi:protein-S-isoprenylcysteine O-methyltransferase Ste14